MELKITIEEKESFVIGKDSISRYLDWERGKGLSEKMLRQIGGQLRSFYGWLPEEKLISKEVLRLWRQDMGERNYSEATISSYVKSLNRYLDYTGHSELRFNRGRSHDLRNMRFGYLTALEPTGERSRKDIVWLCRCECGKECKVPAASLVSGNTFSCGCLRGEHFKEINRYIDGTSLRQSIEEKVLSPQAESGYTGVTKKRGKWRAYIKYKGHEYTLGCYSKLEDAVKARARGKEEVRKDAMALAEIYEQQHKNDPERPSRRAAHIGEERSGPKAQTEQRAHALRSDNTSGCPGVHRKRNKWVAKISYQKRTYQLGSFADLDSAVFARKEAEKLLAADPQQFAAKYGA